MSAKNPPAPGDHDDLESYRLAFCKFVCENPEFAKVPEFEGELHKLKTPEFGLLRSTQDLFEDNLWPEIELRSSSDESESDQTKISSEVSNRGPEPKKHVVSRNSTER